MINKYNRHYNKYDSFFVSYFIIAINIIVFLMLELFGGSTNIQVLYNFGAFTQEAFLEGQYFRVITSTFIHIGYWHLINNMVALYIWGRVVEQCFGTFKYLGIYFLSGMISSFGSGFFIKNAISAGASGAIYGLMGCVCAASLIRKRNIGGFDAGSIFFMVILSFTLIATDPRTNYAAHFIGFLVGFLMSAIFCLIDDMF